VVVVQSEAGREGMVVQHLAAVVGGELALVEPERVVGIAKRDRAGVAVGVGFVPKPVQWVRDTVWTAPLRAKCSSHS